MIFHIYLPQMSENPDLGGTLNGDYIHAHDGSLNSDDHGDLKSAIHSLAQGRKVHTVNTTTIFSLFITVDLLLLTA